MRINFLQTKKGERIDLPNKITVFVGPNNAGKSQTLKDIRCMLDRQQSPIKEPVILRDDTSCFNIPTLDDVRSFLYFKDSTSNVNHYTVGGILCNLIQRNSVEIHKPQMDKYDASDDEGRFLFFQYFSKYYFALMDAETRLKLSSETTSFNPLEKEPENLLHTLFKNQDIEKMLQEAFLGAFQQNIKLDISQLTKLCFRIGKEVAKIPADTRVAHKVAKNFPKLDSQGDGYRSFAGIIVGLLLCKERIIMLDEPEAFLHPAQAFYLGKWIGENQGLLGSQLLICTHSSNFLSGMLTGTQELQIIRLQRDGNDTTYNVLAADIAVQLIKNPILSSQRVIEGIFHKGVVICEADADRAIYQSVASICHNSNREILFIHAHNKQTLAVVADVLKDTGTPVTVIADIDILRPGKDLENVYKVLTGQPLEEELNRMQDMLVNHIDSRPEDEVFQELKSNIDKLVEQLNKNEHSLEGARAALKRIHGETSKWSAMKKQGIRWLNDEQRENASQLISYLSKVGFFVVPVGELEGWIDLVEKRKNKWIVPALEAIYDQKTPRGLRLFVGDVLNFFKGNGCSNVESWISETIS